MGKHGHTGIPKPFVKLVRKALVKVSVHENVKFGANFRVGRGVIVSSPHGLVIGDDVSVGPRSIIQVDGEIGNWAIIGMGVQIVGRLDHAITEIGVPITQSTRASERAQLPRDVVEIGKDVWIGGSSVILSGISIGEGAVVGAGSVVVRDVPAYTIVGGNPAHFIRNRFDTDEERHQHQETLLARENR